MKYSTSLKLNHIFRRLYRTSGVADGLLVLYARKNRTDGNRVGITVSKKLGKAHVRNRTRRRIREVYRLNEEKFQPGWDIVVVARTRAVEAPFEKLTASYLTLAKKAGILKPVALDLPGVSGTVPVSPHLFRLCLRSHQQVRYPQGRLACPEAVSAMQSLLPRGYLRPGTMTIESLRRKGNVSRIPIIGHHNRAVRVAAVGSV